MGKARNLSKLSSVLTTDGVVPSTKGGTGTTTGAASGGGGPKISSIVVTNSSYTTLDDTAVDVAGGYIKIIGTGFESGCQVLINNITATSVTYISATEVRAQVPATAAGTYIVYLVNSDGGTAIRVNGITFSSTPTWVSTSPLTALANSAISTQLSATGATTFALASGSSLPSGITLSSSGLLSGTVTGITVDTTYNFTIVAIDAELQDSPQSFAFNISAGDPYFKYSTLLLSANGTNGAQNNSFVDSSTNNFAVTRAGNTTQGTFSPYGPNWSNYFDGTGDYLTIPANAALNVGTGDFTWEGWVYLPNDTGDYSLFSGAGGGDMDIRRVGTTFRLGQVNNSWDATSSTIAIANSWTHLAMSRSSSTLRMYVNGVQVYTGTNTFNYSIATSVQIGRTHSADGLLLGYLSNTRLVKGTALYTTAFTPPTAPLTAIANTSLLTCQSNRFVDNSTNNFTITKNGDVSVQRFSPFSPSAAYSTSVIGGSAYFDASTSYVSVPNNAALQLGSSNFTIEFWTYLNGTNGELLSLNAAGNLSYMIDVYNNNATLYGTSNNSSWDISSGLTFGTVPSNAWSHIAVSRSGNSIYCFVNGVLGRTITSSASFYASTAALTIGNDRGTGIASGGYISDLRIVKGTAVYTSAFTPPTAPVTAITNTSLLCNFTNAGIVDATMQNNLQTVGDAKISTTQSKYGGSSMYFDGTGDYLTIPNNGWMNLGTTFTIEFWFYRTATQAMRIISRQDGSSPYNGYNISYGEVAGQWYFDASGTAITFADGGLINQWVHYAWVVNGTSGTVYRNGISVGTATQTAQTPSTNTTLHIGSKDGPTNYVGGYVDDLRITKGYARYTANFTPPGAAAPQ